MYRDFGMPCSSLLQAGLAAPDAKDVSPGLSECSCRSTPDSRSRSGDYDDLPGEFRLAGHRASFDVRKTSNNVPWRL